MGTISDKLMRIINTKEDIRRALISKGYDVPTSIPFKEYAKMILDLPCNADSFPDIEGIVARYSALGLTNEQMAENPVWKNLTGNGHDLQMKNFAWKGMSGVGGYKFDFLLNEWVTSNDQISEKYSYKIVINNKQNSVQLINNSRHIKITLKITGIEINKSIFRVYDNAGMEHKQDYTKDGIYEIDYTANEGANRIYFYVVGGNMGQLENPITIEQLPLYPGALVFDGVDDYGVCENFPILTKEKGYTVVALRQWIEEKNDSTALVSNCKNWGQDGAFLFEYNNLRINFLNVAISFGHMSSVDRGKSPFSYQTSKLYNGKNIEPGSFIGSNELVVGKGNKNFPTVSKAAIWELVFLDHDATEEELTKIKDYFVKTYPWLFPDQAWTVTGKTNEDEDRATIANITGNGNDLVLSNFGFAEGSGYGLYKTPFELYPSVQHSSKYSLSFSKFALGDHNLIIAPKQNDLSYDIKVKVTGLKDGVKFKWGWIGTTGYIDITTDGIHMLNKPASQIRQLIVEFAEDFDPDHVVTIEQIPEYEGYLVTDGVDDKVESGLFTLNKDWTIVGNWTMLSNIPSNCGIIKVSSMFLYNSLDGVTIYFAGGPIKIQSKSINAFCSDGRIYLNDWTEILKPDAQIASGGSKSCLNIASYSAKFTKMAFKNLAIYDGKNLSKDDCIKAYNYLQTLKSK